MIEAMEESEPGAEPLAVLDGLDARTGATWFLLHTGVISGLHAKLLADAIAPLADEQCRLVEAYVFRAADHPTYAAWRRRIRYALHKYGPRRPRGGEAAGTPGCGHRARHADLDHTTKYRDGGATSRKNLQLHRPRHHRAKDQDGTGWTAKVNDDGSTTITDPTGHTYRVWPHDHRGP